MYKISCLSLYSLYKFVNVYNYIRCISFEVHAEIICNKNDFLFKKLLWKTLNDNLPQNT